MATDFHVYDPDQVTIAIAGIPMRGYADGEFLTIEMETDAFADVCGSSGEVVRTRSNDRRATAVIKLLAASGSNDLLSAIYNTDQNAQNGAGVGAFMVRDRTGRSLFSATNCWISKAPNVSFDKTPGSREWTIRIARLERFDGGS